MNPFKPTAGKLPPILIGRQNVLDAFRLALEDGAGAPGRLMLISGQRGFGKTVMLTELAKIALSQDWIVITETASSGLIDRLTTQLQSGMHVSKIDIQPSVSISGLVSAGLGGASLETKTQSLTLRQAIETRLKKVKPGRGILFTIDEAQAAATQDLVALATTFQQVVADIDMAGGSDSSKRGIALVMAALPGLTDDVLQDSVLTFLRRSMQFTLGDIYDAEVTDAYVKTVKDSGKKISADLAHDAARAAAGYPYMVQLIGYYMWQHAQLDNRQEILEEDLNYAIEISSQAFENAVCAPEFNSLTSAQQEFLISMAKDTEGPSNVADLASRVQKSMSWVNKYRKSLIDAQVIVAAGHGKVDFAIPELKNYIIKKFGD